MNDRTELSSRRAPVPAPQPISILLVDDEPRNLDVLDSILNDPDYRLIRARSADEALLALIHEDFAAIVLDINMPDMNGIELAQLIKKRKRCQHIPIIFLTAYFQEDKDVLHGYNVGAVDYLTKPVNPQILKSKVAVFVELFRTTRALAEANTALELEIVRREAAQEALRQANNELEARVRERTSELTSMMHAIPDVLFVTTADGRIQFANPAADRFAHAISMSHRLPVPIQAELTRVVETGTDHLPANFNTVHRFEISGEYRYFLSRIVTMTTDDHVFGAVVMLQDVTEFRLLDEVKTNVIATVSHELKTPITSLRTALLVLLEQTIGTVNEKQLEMIRIARDETERLLRTLHALLDLTRFEHNAIGLKLEHVRPDELVQSAVEAMLMPAKEASITIRVDMESDLPRLHVDRERILHVFTNLLTNAIKYSPSGEEITLRARKQNEGICFSVLDRGPGVPREHHSRLFEKFFRVPGTKEKGVGLGLWIARQFIQSHRGWIGVNSDAGQGSEFYFVLPANSAES